MQAFRLRGTHAYDVIDTRQWVFPLAVMVLGCSVHIGRFQVYLDSNQSAFPQNKLTMTPEEQLEMLVDGLRLVAASADDQINALPPYVCITDEIISTFSDAYLLAGQIESAGLIGRNAAAILKTLDDHFEAMPIDEALWDSESLYSHPFWAEARVLAKEALHALGLIATPLILRHVTYVR